MTTKNDKPKNNRVRNWAIIIAVVIILGLIGIAMGGEESTDGTTAADETTSAERAPEEAPAAEEENTSAAQSEELDEFLRGFYVLEPGWEGGEPGHWTTWVDGTHIDGRTLNVSLTLAPGHPDVNQRAEEAANAIGNQIRANQPESAEGVHSIRVNDNQGNRVIQENI